MKTYPSIPKWDKKYYDKEVWVYDKPDGSNIRFEWSKQKGWYKCGTRTQLFTPTDPIWGGAYDYFIENQAKKLSEYFIKNKIINGLAFGEWFGPNSFAGQHLIEDDKKILIFDVALYKKGFLPPIEFNKLEIDKVDLLYHGNWYPELVSDVQRGKFNVNEGVIIKGLEDKKIFRFKVKTLEWLERVKNKNPNLWLEEEQFLS
jgi:hypothetical protein